MKTVLLFALIIFTTLQLYGQQETHYSQYMVNNYMLNPALGGSTEFLEARVGYRAQWVGFEGAPTTAYFTIHAPLGRVEPTYISKKAKFSDLKRYNPRGFHGLGSLIFIDKTGPLSRTGAYLSYSYNMALGENLRVAMGTFLGAKQYYVNGDKLVFYEEGDPLQPGGVKWIPDASIGTWIYNKRVFIGLSINQIFKNSFDIVEVGTNNGGKLFRHYFFTGGYNIKVSPDISLVPSILVRMVSPTPPSLDLNLKAKYNQICWGGLSYRDKESFIILAGFTLKNKIDFSYSFDLITSRLKYHNAGTHELTIGFRLAPKGTVYSPSDFW